MQAKSIKGPIPVLQHNKTDRGLELKPPQYITHKINAIIILWLEIPILAGCLPCSKKQKQNCGDSSHFGENSNTGWDAFLANPD